jgi:hypothetical protein
MVAGELIDIQAANIEAREILKREAARQAASLCNASGANAFVNAVTWYQDAVTEIERKGWCLACGGPLVGESICAKCGRDNK